MALWQEFLAGFFDGHDHDVDALNRAVTFPAATLEFGQVRNPQPLNGALITLMWLSPGRVRPIWEMIGPTGDRHVGKMGLAEVTWMFWIRAKVVDVGAGNSVWLATLVASRLYGVLANRTACAPLALKGIDRLNPDSPVTVVDSDYAIRLVACRSRLRYPLSVQDL